MAEDIVRVRYRLPRDLAEAVDQAWREDVAAGGRDGLDAWRERVVRRGLWQLEHDLERRTAGPRDTADAAS